VLTRVWRARRAREPYPTFVSAYAVGRRPSKQLSKAASGFAMIFPWTVVTVGGRSESSALSHDVPSTSVT
jgi:hypothetical protein